MQNRSDKRNVRDDEVRQKKASIEQLFGVLANFCEDNELYRTCKDDYEELVNIESKMSIQAKAKPIQEEEFALVTNDEKLRSVKPLGHVDIKNGKIQNVGAAKLQEKRSSEGRVENQFEAVRRRITSGESYVCNRRFDRALEQLRKYTERKCSLFRWYDNRHHQYAAKTLLNRINVQADNRGEVTSYTTYKPRIHDILRTKTGNYGKKECHRIFQELREAADSKNDPYGEYANDALDTLQRYIEGSMTSWSMYQGWFFNKGRHHKNRAIALKRFLGDKTNNIDDKVAMIERQLSYYSTSTETGRSQTQSVCTVSTYPILEKSIKNGNRNGSFYACLEDLAAYYKHIQNLQCKVVAVQSAFTTTDSDESTRSRSSTTYSD